MRSLVAGVVVLSAFVVAPPVEAQTMKLGEALVFYLPELRTGVDTKAFETHVATEIIPAWRKSAPGMDLVLVRKDRGARAGQYMLVWTTDTLARRKAYSAAGDFPFSAALIAKTGDFRKGLATYVSGGKYVEYQLVAPDKAGAPLPEIDLLGNHHIQVRPDRIAAFDRFVADRLHPTVGNLRPDLRFLYYKPVRGEEPGNYLTVIALTKVSRDKYWPKGQDSDQLKAAFSKPVTALADELRPYLVEGSYATGNLAAAVYESKQWTDWVLVP